MKYRKKPVIIEAIQFNGNNIDELRTFVGSHLVLNNSDILSIKTLEGDMLVRRDDYIIKGVNGEFYPCKPDIFEKTYEEVAESLKRPVKRQKNEKNYQMD